MPVSSTTRAHLAAGLPGDAHPLDSGRAVAAPALAILRHARIDDVEQAEQEEEPARKQCR